jgi:hypothetical protein
MKVWEKEPENKVMRIFREEFSVTKTEDYFNHPPVKPAFFNPSCM